MATRLPASQRTREELTALIEGRLSTASAKDELVKLATRLIVEEALEGEAGRRAGARLLRARGAAGPGLPQWVSHGTAEDGRGSDGLFGAADRGPG
jgi:putative transposase